MDPRHNAHDVHRCVLCENAIVHIYCDFCHVNLCIPWTGKHIADGYDKHKIVEFQERRSTLIYSKCKTNPHKIWEFQWFTSDSQSCILTADFDNHCIQILDQKGQSLRYFNNSDLKNPSGLCVDYNDILFVCEYIKSNVKKIKYLK